MPDSRPVPFLCECADDGCTATVELRLGEWEDISSWPNRFVMVAGHPRSEGEQVVGRLGEYELVEKPT